MNFAWKLKKNDINTVHRLGQKTPNQSADKRPFIIKFCRRDLKREVIQASKKQTRPKIYVNESLSAARRKVFHTLRSIKKAHPEIVKGVTTLDGKVFVYTQSENPAVTRDVRHLVNNQESLSNFCVHYIKRPLDALLLSFGN